MNKLLILLLLTIVTYLSAVYYYNDVKIQIKNNNILAVKDEIILKTNSNINNILKIYNLTLIKQIN